jgi:hypothetical protein
MWPHFLLIKKNNPLKKLIIPLRKILDHPPRTILAYILGSILVILLLSLPTINMIYSFKEFKRYVPHYDTLKVDEKGAYIYLYLQKMDPINLILEMSVTIQINRDSVGSDVSAILDLIKKGKPGDHTIMIKLNDPMLDIINSNIRNRDTSITEINFNKIHSDYYGIVTNSVVIKMPILGKLRLYPLDLYYFHQDIEILYRSGSKSPYQEIGIKALVVSSDIKFFESNFRYSISRSKSSFGGQGWPVVKIYRQRTSQNHVVLMLTIMGFIVATMCIFIVKIERQTADPIWSVITGTAAMIFATIQLRNILIPSYITTITLVDIILSFYITVLLCVLLIRMLKLSSLKSRDFTGDGNKIK